jgi:uncharacterized protein YigA (DUF484 family)
MNTPSMSDQARLDRYRRQSGTVALTARQERRARHKRHRLVAKAERLIAAADATPRPMAAHLQPRQRR